MHISNIRYIYFVSILFFLITPLSLVATIPLKDVKLLYRMKCKNSFIAFVQIKNKEYVVKQKKAEKASLLLSIIKDALAAFIAQDLTIAHSVEIIPATDNCIGKMHQNVPALLLTKAPGISVKSLQNHQFHTLAIRQCTPGKGKVTCSLGLTKKS